jgi:hypothetical protein
VKTWIVHHYRLIEHTANSGTSFDVTVTISVKDGRTVVEVTEAHGDAIIDHFGPGLNP